MDAKLYIKVSVLNFAFLLVGIVVGAMIVLTLFVTGTVHAQADGKAVTPPTKIDSSPKQITGCDDAHFECVSPGISSGTAAFSTLLAHKFASDQLQVNGYEPLKLFDNTMRTLIAKGLLTAAEAQKITADSKTDKPLRLQTQ